MSGQLLRESLIRADITVMGSTCSKSWTAVGETGKVDLVSFPQCIKLREKKSY